MPESHRSPRTRRGLLTWVAAPATVIVVAVLHIAHLDLVSLATVPVAVALVLPIKLTLVLRLIVALGLTYSGNVVMGWLLGLVGIPAVPVSIALSVLIPLGGATSLGWVTPRLGRLFDGGDVIAIIAGLLVLALLWLPAYRDDSATMLSRLVPGEDNSAHLGIVQAIVAQRGLLFGAAKRLSGQDLPGHTAYPPGFHLNVALLAAAAQDLLGTASPRLLVRVYFFSAIGLQAAWATTTVMAIRALAAMRQVSLVALAVLASGTVLFFIFGPPGDLLLYGFQPQVAAIWLLVSGVLLAVTPDLQEHTELRLGLVLVAMVGTVWCWYLVAPVPWLAALAIAWLNRTALIRSWHWTLPIVTAATLLSLPPIYFGVDSGATAYLNATGGVYLLDHVFIAMVVVVGVTFAFLPDRLRNRSSHIIYLACLLGAGVLALGLYWYQIRTTGVASYFFDKLLYTVIAVAAVGAGATALVVASAGATALGLSFTRQLALGLAVGVLGWLITAVVTPLNPGRQYLNRVWAFEDVGALNHMLASAPAPDAKQVLFWSGGGSVRLDYLRSRFAAAIYLRNTDARNDFVARRINDQDDHKLLQLLRQTPAGLRLITRNRDLRDRLVAAGFTPADMHRVTIDIFSDPFSGGPAGLPAGTFDISPRGLLPTLFQTRSP